MIPYWDMIFTEGDEPRDTSAAAIAVCGLLEMNKHVKSGKNAARAEAVMRSLCDKYLTDEGSNGILKEGMYTRPGGSEPECNIWGDYFFMEALMHFAHPDCELYW